MSKLIFSVQNHFSTVKADSYIGLDIKFSLLNLKQIIFCLLQNQSGILSHFIYVLVFFYRKFMSTLLTLV